MLLHHVRAFWRYRLGRLKFIRQHRRDPDANGNSRRRYIVKRDEDRAGRYSRGGSWLTAIRRRVGARRRIYGICGRRLGEFC
jgi:hypothetical protein